MLIYCFEYYCTISSCHLKDKVCSCTCYPTPLCTYKIAIPSVDYCYLRYTRVPIIVLVSFRHQSCFAQFWAFPLKDVGKRLYTLYLVEDCTAYNWSQGAIKKAEYSLFGNWKYGNRSNINNGCLKMQIFSKPVLWNRYWKEIGRIKEATSSALQSK